MQTTVDPTYSWIIPVKNESLSLPELFAQIRETGLRNAEIVAIDDASTDGSLHTLQKLQSANRALKILHSPHHIGKWAALARGFAAAKGSIIITIDSDLQDDPRELPKLLQKIRGGYDVVSGWRRTRHDPWFNRKLSFLGNALASRITGYQFHDLNAPFKVYRRDALSLLPYHGTQLRFSLLFAKKLGLRTCEVPIIHRPRKYGVSKFGPIKYIRILYDLLLIPLFYSGSGRITEEKTR